MRRKCLGARWPSPLGLVTRIASRGRGNALLVYMLYPSLWMLREICAILGNYCTQKGAIYGSDPRCNRGENVPSTINSSILTAVGTYLGRARRPSRAEYISVRDGRLLGRRSELYGFYKNDQTFRLIIQSLYGLL